MYIEDRLSDLEDRLERLTVDVALLSQHTRMPGTYLAPGRDTYGKIPSDPLPAHESYFKHTRPPVPQCGIRTCPWRDCGHAPHPWDFTWDNQYKEKDNG